MDSKHTPINSSKSRAHLVATGIFASRILGFVRESIFAHYLGNTDAADVFRAAMRIPNFLQNLFGEGVLSASFIPVYANLLGTKKNEEAAKLASAIFCILTVVASILVLLGVYFTPQLIDLITPGFVGEKREQAIVLVRIFFPGTGALVLSAWCLGILNSHRRFLLSYTAPVLWNLAIIASLLIAGRYSADYQLAIWVSWGAVVGSLLQALVQMPSALGYIGQLSLTFGRGVSSVTVVLKNFVPVVIGRGVVQISAYIDSIIASFLASGSLSALSYAQTLYVLPVSLFGMSVAASELPEMSRINNGEPEAKALILSKLNRGLRQMSFFVVPTMFSFVVFGNIIVAVLYQSGRFNIDDTYRVWFCLAAFSLGLVAATSGRLFASTLYALRDTKSPLYCASVRVVISALLGCYLGFNFANWLGLPDSYGIVGLAIASAIASWLECLLLKILLSRRLGKIVVGETSEILELYFTGAAATALAFAADYFIANTLLPVMRGAIVLGLFTFLYIGISVLRGNSEARALVRR